MCASNGRLNQRYALLFRDYYLRADAAAAGAYGQVKRALAQAVPDDWDTYYATVKDPACDLIMGGGGTLGSSGGLDTASQ